LEKTSAQNWQKIIWQEWRHTSDLEFAGHLFNLVSGQPTGWGTRLSLTLVSIASGASLGVLVISPLTLRWDTLKYMAIAGGIVGAAYGFFRSQGLTWQDWIHRLQSNTPTTSIAKMVSGVLLLACVGGMVFGPVFWLMMAGLFWAIGGLISWINRGMDDLDKYDPEDRRWWFWWRKRPPLNQLETALQQASDTSPEAAEVWAEPLQRLAATQRRPPPPETLINMLTNNTWSDRFVARHTLVALGREAVYPLQAIATQNDTPLTRTAGWLLENIGE
jgi:hypothetical protein